MVQQNPKRSKKEIKKYHTPEELYEMMKQIKNPKNIQQMTVTSEPIQVSMDDKVEIMGKGLIFITWVFTVLFSGVLILIAILYEFPLNITIMLFAAGMDVIVVWMTRKYMSKSS